MRSVENVGEAVLPADMQENCAGWTWSPERVRWELAIAAVCAMLLPLLGLIAAVIF